MARMFQTRSFQFLCVFVLLAAGGCACNQGTMQTCEINQPSLRPVMPNLISPGQLAGSGLEIVWQGQLPLRQNEIPAMLKILGNQICMLSNRHFLAVADRNNGQAAFSRTLTDPGLPIIGVDLYGRELFVSEDGGLATINSESGAVPHEVKLGFSIACPSARNSSFFYVAGTDRRIRVLRAEDKVKMFEVGAEDGSAITSVVAEEALAIFTTDSGFCVAFSYDAPHYLWKFKAEDAIAGLIAKDAESVFFASKDTYLYRVKADTGKLVWKCPMGTRLEKGPDVTQKCVYQYCDKGLVAIDRQSGKILWTQPEGISLLAEAGDNAYITTGADGIIVMDNVQRQKAATINVPDFSKHAVNTIDSQIYIIDDAGRIACLKPAK